MRAAATRRARKGTVKRPTMRDRNNAEMAKMEVASVLPRSGATDENTAAVNARLRPATAMKNRCQASRSTLDHTDFRYSRMPGLSVAQPQKFRVVPKVLKQMIPEPEA